MTLITNCVILLKVWTLVTVNIDAAVWPLSYLSTSPSLLAANFKFKEPLAQSEDIRPQTAKQNDLGRQHAGAQEGRLGLGSFGTRRINPLKTFMVKNRVSPLYLINGTVCRYVNFQPICTTLSTTGLSVGGAPGGGGGGGGARPAGGGGGSSGGGSGGGGARPSGGGGGGSGGGGSSGGGGGGSSGQSGGSSGSARPPSSGVQSGGSSVQFANQPSRASAVMQEEPTEMFVERLDHAVESPPGGGDQRPQPQSQVVATAPAPSVAPTGPVGLLISRRPGLGLLPFRRQPVQYQLLTNRREEILREKAQTKN